MAFLKNAYGVFTTVASHFNLLDGMVAVEHNQSSPNGELFNDVADRFADVFIIIGGSLAIISGLPLKELRRVHPVVARDYFYKNAFTRAMSKVFLNSVSFSITRLELREFNERPTDSCVIIFVSCICRSFWAICL